MESPKSCADGINDERRLYSHFTDTYSVKESKRKTNHTCEEGNDYVAACDYEEKKGLGLLATVAAIECACHREATNSTGKVPSSNESSSRLPLSSVNKEITNVLENGTLKSAELITRTKDTANTLIVPRPKTERCADSGILMRRKRPKTKATQRIFAEVGLPFAPKGKTT